MKIVNGRWEGLSIDLWRATAEKMNVDFEVQGYKSIAAIVDAMVNGDVDVIPQAFVASEYEVYVDFTNHYYRSGLAIAVRADSAGIDWWGVIDRLISLQFLMFMGFLILLWIVAGAFVWLLENRQNPEMFGGGPIKGLAHGVWWAAVTMTTVGYGDKTPKTVGGRIIAVIWMLASVIVISGFTAAVTTSLTVRELSGKFRGLDDLQKVRVGSLALSTAQAYLEEKGISVSPFENDRDGLQAIVDSKIDAFVHEASILTYLAKTQFQSRITVLPETFDHFYIGMALPSGSHLREPLNRAILNFMETNDWKRLLEKYFGSSE